MPGASQPFDNDYPVTFAQGRNGAVYVFGGHGKIGQAYSPTLDEWRDVGMEAPDTAPVIFQSLGVKYYIARIDITNNGTNYFKPPIVSIDGTPSLAATAITRLREGCVSAIQMTAYGKGYSQTPTVTLSASPYGNTSPPATATADAQIKYTTQFRELAGPKGPNQYQIPEMGYVSSLTITDGGNLYTYPPNVRIEPTLASAQASVATATASLSATTCGTTATATSELKQVDWTGGFVGKVTVTDGGSGYSTSSPPGVKFSKAPSGGLDGDAGATVDAFGKVSEITVINGGAYSKAPTVTIDAPTGKSVESISVDSPGSGYSQDHPPTVTIVGDGTGAKATATVGSKGTISGFTVTDGGCGYTSAPTVTVAFPPAMFANGGGGASATATIENGVVTGLVITNGGDGYTTAPSVTIDPPQCVRAEAFAVARAHLRGVYQCYYRYVNDSIPPEEGGPLVSSLSPVTEVDCGDGKEFINWSVPSGNADPPAAKGWSIELWRSTSNQATTLFRVAKLAGDDAFGSTHDDLTDWELIDPAREGFQAMPILLPNGELNANRFGVPPNYYSTAVMFQDRLWMAVDTGGGNQNTIRYSEVDEPESMPDVNELLLQSNLRASDHITALIPYAGALIVAQSRHCHRLTYVAQPLIDANVYLLAYRGVLNQRCWDIFDGRIYAMDDQGVYSLDPQGNVESLTLGLYDIWQDKIDYSLSKWFSVRVDKKNSLLRVCVAVKEDGSTKFPSRMYVYSFDFKTWWEERYPEELTCATEVRMADGRIALVYGTSSGDLRTLGENLTDQATGSIHSVTIANPGRGYRFPPAITAAGGHGATFECGLDSNGSITGIVIKTPGTQYEGGNLLISPPADGGTQATATYTVTTGSQPVYWSFKSGAFEFVSDATDKRGGEAQTRHCSVVYKPTPSTTLLNLKAYYNNAAYPRSNVARRDRGTGFVHSDTVPAAVLDMKATPHQEAEASGVARALFTGGVLDDMTGNDRHVAIALAGKQDDPGGKVIIHSLDVFGVNEQG